MQIRFTLRYLYMIIMCRYAVPIYIYSRLPPVLRYIAVICGYLPISIIYLPTDGRFCRDRNRLARPASAEDIIPVRRTSRYSITFFFFSLSLFHRDFHTTIIINTNIIIIIIIAIASGGIFHGYRENVHRKQ